MMIFKERPISGVIQKYVHWGGWGGGHWKAKKQQGEQAS